MILTVSEVGTRFPQIQVHHKYKGHGKDPNKVGSHRPLGMSDPLLSLLPDIIYTRMSAQTAAYAGPSQQGGHTDSRFMVIMQSDAKGIRHKIGLPTVESNADARYGLDGGRHVQVLCQLYKSRRHSA